MRSDDVDGLPETVSVGQYLALRLKQLNVEALFGLPGDFNLTLLDEMLSVPGMEWVGSTNELNAAYAADAYGRMRRGLGAMVTTYGVGELSAVNGIAGSYAEDVPVVQITGLPTTAARANHSLVHHSLADGDHGHFVRVYRELTAASAVLRADNAASEIDRVLLSALTTSKPVYLAVPADVAHLQIPSRGLTDPLTSGVSDPAAVQRFSNALRYALQGQNEVVVLAGSRLHRCGLEPELAELVDVPGVLVAAQPHAKAIIDESHPSSLGTYMGALTPSSGVRSVVDGAVPVVLAGAVLSDLLTGGFSHEFNVSEAIELGMVDARVGPVTFHGVHLQDAVATLTEVVRELGLSPATAPDQSSDSPEVDIAGPLNQAGFWSAIQGWLAEGTVIIADAGTSYYGALGLTLPDGSNLLGQPIWSSIGYTIPATLGVVTASPSCRAVLFVGDGAAQLTIQEIATILTRGMAPVIFVLNNRGYTVERVIQSPAAAYQDISEWNWTALPAALAPDSPSEAVTVRTQDELLAALALADAVTDRLVFVEVILGQNDAPPILAALGAMLAKANQSR